jgi:hypothetical protein
LVARFRFEACFTLGIVASSIPVKEFRVQRIAIVRSAKSPRKTRGTHDHASDHAMQIIQFLFIFMNDLCVAFWSIVLAQFDAAPQSSSLGLNGDRRGRSTRVFRLA